MRNNLEWWFDYYNKKYFGGKLETCRVKYDKKLYRRENAFGVYFVWRCGCKSKKHPDKPEINIATEIKFSGKWTLATLLHEMCHMKLDHKNDKLAHGPKFQKEMLRLAKVGAFKNLW